MTKRTVSEILEHLNAANVELHQRQQAESFARNARTESLNRVNQLQKELDEAVAEAKKTAPPDSDWWRHRNQRPY